MGTRGGMSRRRLLQAGGWTLFAGASVASLPLFGTEGATQDPATCKAPDESADDKSLVVSNWPGYIDPMRKRDSTMNVFQDQSGISVKYTPDINDNAEFFAKIRNQMGACEPIGRDIITMSDWMCARMIGLGWIQPLDRSKLPNVEKNLLPALRKVQWDKKGDLHVPWQSGLTGVAYNSKLTGEIRSFSELVTRPDLKGKITLLKEMRDTMAFFLRMVDADPDDFTRPQWENALDKLAEVVASGHVRAFTGNDYIQDLAAGNIVACEAWSGDVIQVQYDNPDIKFVTPEEGLSLWSDSMMVPNKATHQANAEEYMNYWYEPAVAAKLAAWVNYICPVVGAREEMEKLDPSLVDNPLIFPSDEELEESFDFMPLSEADTRDYEREWSDVIAG